MVSLIYEFTCPACSEPAKGVMVHTVRVNKGSLRTVGTGLGFIPRWCDGCGTAIEPVVARASIADKDLPKVNAARVKRGWPELSSGQVTVREEVRDGA